MNRRIFPCGPDKRPLTPHGFKDASDDPATIAAWWKRWPDALTGMPTGAGLVVIDTDLKNGKDGESSLCELEGVHGVLPPTRTVETMNGGLHRYFTGPADTKIQCSADKLGRGVDIRGDGGYVIIPPSPGYVVAVDMPIAPLPDAWVALLTKRGNLEALPPPPLPVDDAQKGREALRFIPADCSRDLWIEIGMACQGAGMTFDDFDSWSAGGGATYAGPADTLKTWRSFTGSGRGIGTLIHIAKQYGYRPAGDTFTTTTGPTIRARKKTPWRDVTRDQAIDAVKDCALWPIVEACAAVMDPPLPIEFTLPKAIVLAGCALSGRRKFEDGDAAGLLARGSDAARLRIETSGGQVCNTFAMIAADSSSGKDIGNVADTLAYRRGFSLGDTGSAEGLQDALIERGSGLLVIPEFKNWLDPNHWQAKAGSFITSSFNRGHFRQRLSTRGKENTERSSLYCYPNILANVQPGTIQRYATGADIASGMLGRFLFTVGPNHYGRPTTNDTRHLVNDADAALQAYERKEGRVTVPPGYLQDVFNGFAKNGAPLFSCWGRLVNEYGPRLAVMLATGADDTSRAVHIRDDHWHRAGVLVQWFFGHAETLLTDIHDDPAARLLEALCAKIARFIARNPGCCIADISHACGRGSTAKQRRDAVGELCDRGELTAAEGRYFPAEHVMQGVA